VGLTKIISHDSWLGNEELRTDSLRSRACRGAKTRGTEDTGRGDCEAEGDGNTRETPDG
jgi:hypothetical protein